MAPAFDYHRRVFYEIFIRSFADSNGDGIGDLNGITASLDDLQWLGIDGLWLTPFCTSPSYHKYDIEDFYTVDPEFGTLSDLQTLVKEAHRRNMKVLMDLVVNHTSLRHPWFRAALGGSQYYQNFYHWQDAPSATTEGAWHKTLIQGVPKWYYAFFSRHMPDLNYDFEPVRKAIIDMACWWVRHTDIDGFRLDAAQHIYSVGNDVQTIAWWKEFAMQIRQEKPGILLIGECWNNSDYVARYLQALDGVFNFELTQQLTECLREEKVLSLQALISSIPRQYVPYNSSYVDAIFLSNHDMDRMISALDNQMEKARLAACILLTLPGTPFLYYGEEIGMRGRKPDKYLREPYVWHWAIDRRSTTWLKPRYSTVRNVTPWAIQKQNRKSLLHLYRRLIRLRRLHPALSVGHWESLESTPESIFGYRRRLNADHLLVLHNLGKKRYRMKLPSPFAEGQLVFTSQPSLSRRSGWVSLPPYGSVILKC